MICQGHQVRYIEPLRQKEIGQMLLVSYTTAAPTQIHRKNVASVSQGEESVGQLGESNDAPLRPNLGPTRPVSSASLCAACSGPGLSYGISTLFEPMMQANKSHTFMLIECGIVQAEPG
ncbi:hypothetical protein BH24CHL1_BH24CHL1_09130 [soil metagenome]